MEDIKMTDEYVYILDFTYGRIVELRIKKEDVDLDSEALLTKYGFNIDNCNFMYSNGRLNLEIINDADE
jgi:hypothetical protein